MQNQQKKGNNTKLRDRVRLSTYASRAPTASFTVRNVKLIGLEQSSQYKSVISEYSYQLS